MQSAFIARFEAEIGLGNAAAMGRKVAYNTEARILDAGEQGLGVFGLNSAFPTHS